MNKQLIFYFLISLGLETLSSVGSQFDSNSTQRHSDCGSNAYSFVPDVERSNLTRAFSFDRDSYIREWIKEVHERAFFYNYHNIPFNRELTQKEAEDFKLYVQASNFIESIKKKHEVKNKPRSIVDADLKF